MEPLYKKYSKVTYTPDGEVADFALTCGDDFNFAYDVVDKIAEQEPQRTALVWCDENGDEKIITFAQLAVRSVQVANYLRQRGVGKGSRVMLILKRHYSYWYTLLALHRLGAVAIPATHMLMPEDIVYRVNTARVGTVICVGEEKICTRIREAQPLCPDLQLLLCTKCDADGFDRLETGADECETQMQRVPTRLSDPMLLYFTSGTTGYPKAVLHNFAYPLCHIPTALCWQQVCDGGLHLSVADTGWAKAAWGKIYGQWLCGSAVMVYDCNNLFIPDLLQVVKKYGVTTFCAPPTVYRSMVKNSFDASCFAGVKHCVTAGESMKAAVAQAFLEATGKPVFAGYGQTETVMIAAEMKTADSAYLGKPMPLYEVKLLDDEGNEGREGEIVLRSRCNGAGICTGYLSADGEIQSPYDEQGYFHTGDLAKLSADGHLIFEGRRDDIIKSCGYRISPQEIENVLMTHPDVIDCAVTGVPDGERGFCIKATVVLRAAVRENQQHTEGVLRRFMREQTASYKCPRIFEFKEHLPKTVSGKIRRSALRGAV